MQNQVITLQNYNLMFGQLNLYGVKPTLNMSNMSDDSQEQLLLPSSH